MLKNLTFKICSKIARRARLYARNYVLRVLYHIVLPIAAAAGSKLVLKKPATGLWSELNEKPETGLISKQSGKNWVFYYLSRAFQTQNFRAIFLLPFIILLWATEEDQNMPSPESLMIYTLF